MPLIQQETLWQAVERVFDEEDNKARDQLLPTSTAIRRILKACLYEICWHLEKE
jgi:hypothetical protein